MPKEVKNNVREDLKYYFDIAKPYWLMFLLVMGLITFGYLIEFGQNFIYKTLIDSGTDFAAKLITKDVFIQIAINLGIIFFLTVLVAGLLRYFRLLFLNKFEVDIS